jgi:hypothetical protein
MISLTGSAMCYQGRELFYGRRDGPLLGMMQVDNEASTIARSASSRAEAEPEYDGKFVMTIPSLT